MSYPVKLLSLFIASLAAMALSASCAALVLDAMPSYSITPSLNGLNISYFAKQDQVKINLYLVNHERFPVLCDAEYQGGPDKVDSREQTVAPEKAIEFSFPYPKTTDSVDVQLICVKPDSTGNTDAKANTATESSSTDKATPDTQTNDAANPETVKILETDLSVKY